MKRKLVIAAMAIGVIFSSVISVAAVSALVREKSRADFRRSLQYERALRTPGSVEYVLAAQAQEPPAPAPEPAPAPAPRPGRRGLPTPTVETPPIPIDAPRYEDQFPERDYELYGRSRNAMRLGQNMTVGPNDVVRDAVVIFGDARIAGHVTGNLLVWFGKAEIERTAVIDGDFVSVGGSVTVQEGAAAHRDLTAFYDQTARYGDAVVKWLVH